MKFISSTTFPRPLVSLVTMITCLLFPIYLLAQEIDVVHDSAPTVEPLITDLIAAITAQAGLGGWAIAVGILGVIVMFSVRIIKLLKGGWWDSLSPLAKFLLPFIAAAVGTFIIGLAGALATKVVISAVIAKLIAAAIGAGFAAVTMNEGSAKAGETMDQMMVKKDPNYIPGTLRKKMSLLVGIPNVDKAKDKLGILK